MHRGLAASFANPDFSADRPYSGADSASIAVQSPDQHLARLLFCQTRLTTAPTVYI
jgi:hypothetical protein